MNGAELSFNSSIAEISGSKDGDKRIRALAEMLSKYLNRKVNPIMLMLAQNVKIRDVLFQLNISVTGEVQEMLNDEVFY